MIGGSGSRKTNTLLNLIKNQLYIDKIYLYAKDPNEAKYQNLINNSEKVGLKNHDDPKAFIQYSNDMQDAYQNIEEYNLEKKYKVLIIFLDSTKVKIVCKKITTFLNNTFQSYYHIFQVIWLVQTSDNYINHNNCLGHMLIT